MTLSRCRTITVLTRILPVVAGMTGVACVTDGMNSSTTSSGNASAEPSIVTANDSGVGGRGPDIAETACVQCHGPGFLPVYKKSRSEWLVTIDAMVSQYGAMMGVGGSAYTLTPEERDILADYLADNFGPDAPR
jgi:mono/diheme cytochrome c family protein